MASQRPIDLPETKSDSDLQIGLTYRPTNTCQPFLLNISRHAVFCVGDMLATKNCVGYVHVGTIFRSDLSPNDANGRCEQCRKHTAGAYKRRQLESYFFSSRKAVTLRSLQLVLPKSVSSALKTIYCFEWNFTLMESESQILTKTQEVKKNCRSWLLGYFLSASRSLFNWLKDLIFPVLIKGKVCHTPI